MNINWLRKSVKNFTKYHPKIKNPIKWYIDKPIIWYKDIALIVGIVLMLISIFLGFYGKVLFISTIYQSPVEWLPGIVIWLFSWLVLFIGISLVGWETFRIIRYKITHRVKKAYSDAKKLQKKSEYRAKRLHNKVLEKIAEMTKEEEDSINIK